MSKIIIPTNCIKEITLLSIEEAERLPKTILGLSSVDSWWLRSPGKENKDAAFVYPDGIIKSSGYIVSYTAYSVRPALRISQFDFSNFKIGEIIECLQREWYYVGDDLILSKDIISHHCFNKNVYRKEPNKFQGSNIQKYLQDWLNEQLKSAAKYSIVFDDEVYYYDDEQEVISKIQELFQEDETIKIKVLNNITGKYKIVAYEDFR